MMHRETQITSEIYVGYNLRYLQDYVSHRSDEGMAVHLHPRHRSDMIITSAPTSTAIDVQKWMGTLVPNRI